MPDLIYAIDTRLSPEQQRGVALVTDIVRAHEMNVYLTGGTIRDLVTGFPIRDLDFTVQGNPLRLQKDFEKAGTVITGVDEDLKTLYLTLPGSVRTEVSMARSETYEKAGRGPTIAPATINEDLRRRDFTVNAMALSLNPGSRGLLLDPSNGMADIESKVLRILHNYAFLEDPSRLIRAARMSARFHWPLEERTQARYDAARENNYIEYITSKAIGYEIEQLVYEDDPLPILKTLEKEGWLKTLNAHWIFAKVDSAGLAQVTKLRQQMAEFGYQPDTAPVVLYLLTRRLSDKDAAEIRKLIPRRDLVEKWKRLEDDAKELAKKLASKDAETPSKAWKVLTEARPELILFLQLTGKQQAITQKIANFFGKWRQIRQKLPLPEMVEMRITPALPEYSKIAEEAFMLMLDGKLKSRTEIVNFLKPFEPPPPPPPPAPVRRARGTKAGAATGAGATPGRPGRRRKAHTEDAAEEFGDELKTVPEDDEELDLDGHLDLDELDESEGEDLDSGDIDEEPKLARRPKPEVNVVKPQPAAQRSTKQAEVTKQISVRKASVDKSAKKHGAAKAAKKATPPKKVAGQKKVAPKKKKR